MPRDAAALLDTPARPQRAEGEGRVLVSGGRLKTLYQSGAAKIRLPNAHGAHALEAVLINTAGGLTGGDRMTWRAEALAGSSLTVTTQACEKVYRSAGDTARVATQLTVGDGSRLDWLPQETILFDQARIARTLEADLAPGATLLALEAVVLGRQAMGESVASGAFRDRWRIRREGRLVFADDLNLEGGIAALSVRAAALGGARAFATLVLVTADPERLLEPVRAALGDAGAASAFGGKLVARVVAENGMALRRALIPALSILRQGAPLPRVWTL